MDISIEHNQPMEYAREKFQAAIHEAENRYRNWIGRVDWSDDRRSATVSGSNYEVKFWYDDRDVHAQGSIPWTWKLMEGAMRSQMKKIIDNSA